MDTPSISFIAGAISSFMFICSYVPMLLKALRTRDLHSYSFLHLLLVNAGNLLYWLYIIDLPLGPIWMMHSFYTVSSALLLGLYLFMPAGKQRSTTLSTTIYISIVSAVHIVTYNHGLRHLIQLIWRPRIWQPVETGCTTGSV